MIIDSMPTDSMPTGMVTNTLSRAVEETFGIKADPDDVQKLQAYVRETYGAESSEIYRKVFFSGEAAAYLTVNETYFFREPVHYYLLWDFLPSFRQRRLRICSAATAVGCEAYSIAMLIEAYNKNSEYPISYHIDAFDINPAVIETACRGVYNVRTLREDGSCFHYMADPYLHKSADKYELDNSLKKNICFFVHNLMDELPEKEYDFLFFRNAWIYFTPRSRERVLSNLCAALTRGGILIMGVSETAGVQHPDLENIDRNDVFFFRKMV